MSDSDLRHAMDAYFVDHGTIEGFDSQRDVSMIPQSVETRYVRRNVMSNPAPKRSKFMGVYPTNPEMDYAKDVPWRVAINIRKDNGESDWIYGGFFRTEQTAARAYNMLAIQHLGRDAIINDIGKPTKAQNEEFAQYLSANPQRSQNYRLTAQKARDLIEQYGKFKTHLEARKELPAAPAIEGVL